MQVDIEALERVSPSRDGDALDGTFVGGEMDTSDHMEADICRARSDVAGVLFRSFEEPGEIRLDPPATDCELALSSSALVNVTPPSTRDRETQVFDNNFVVRRGGPIVPGRAAGTVSGCLPELYPYGRGGPDEKRAVQISLAVYFYRMLLDGSRQFAQHPLVRLLAFDIVGRASMMSRGALHVRMRPAMHAPIEGVSVGELRDHLAGKGRERAAVRRGQRAVRAPRGDPSALVMNEVYATLSRFPNSNKERGVWRQEAYALSQFYGFPHVFFTVTPDDVSSLSIMNYEVAVDADVFLDGGLQAMPSRGARFRIVSKDPVADARYFGQMLRIVVRELLGSCESVGRSVEGGGVFGVTKAFFGVMETQGPEALHAHNLVWLRGMPPTVDRVKEAMASHPGFKDRFMLWAESCVTASLPLSEPFVPCTICGGSMVARDIPESAPAGRRHGDAAGTVDGLQLLLAHAGTCALGGNARAWLPGKDLLALVWLLSVGTGSALDAR